RGTPRASARGCTRGSGTRPWLGLLRGYEMSQSNPFIRPDKDYGAVSADDRLRALESFDLEQCRAALSVPGLQKTVEKKLHSRIRQLNKEAR
ncbi:TPA: hypothetical protein ACRXS6_007076, partial [Pseudomonas aeruginosa]